VSRNRDTSRDSIPSETRLTGTGRSVMDNSARGVSTTGPRTRVFALVSDTSTISRTIGVHNTFRATAQVRISWISRHTSASPRSVFFSADSIRTTWIRTTRSSNFQSANCVKTNPSGEYGYKVTLLIRQELHLLQYQLLPVKDCKYSDIFEFQSLVSD